MKHGWCRLAALLALTMVLLLALPQASAQAAGDYVKVNRDSVNLRSDASVQADSWFQLQKGMVCQLLSVEQSGADRWYCVLVQKPAAPTAYVGYIRADMAELLTEGAAAAWENKPVQPDGSCGLPGPRVLVSVNQPTWLYQNAAGTSAVTTLDAGNSLQILRIAKTKDEAVTYLVRSGNRVGYTRADDLRLLCGNVSAVPVEADLWQTTMGSVNLRSDPWQSAGNVLAQIPSKGTPVEVYGRVLTRDADWYLVVYGGQIGYVKGELLKQQGSTADVPAYVETVEAFARVRTQPHGAVLTTIAKAGTQLPYYDVYTEGDYQWYDVAYADGQRGWVYGELVKEIPAAEVQQATVEQTPVELPDAAQVGYVRTTIDKLLLREVPGGVAAGRIEEASVVLPYDTVQAVGGEYWYHVTDASGKTGWICGHYADAITADEAGKPLPEAADEAEDDDDQASSLTGAAASGSGYGRLNGGSAIVRTAPGGVILTKLADAYTTMAYQAVQQWQGETWYLVTYAQDRQGWVNSSCFHPTSMVEIQATAQPAQQTEAPEEAVIGTVATTSSKVHVRATPGGTVVGQVDGAGTTMPCYAAQMYDNAIWYQVGYAEGMRGWMHSDYAQLIAAETTEEAVETEPEEEAPAAVETAEPAPNTGYVMTLTDHLQVRDEPFGDKAVGRIERAETVVPYIDVRFETYVNWYQVEYAPGAYGWVHGAYVTETDAPAADEVATPAEHGPWLGQISTTGKNVLVRSEPGSGDVLAKIPMADTVLHYDDMRTLGDIVWYHAAYAEDVCGWVSGAYAKALVDENLPVPQFASHEQQQTVCLDDDVAVIWTPVTEAELYTVSTMILAGEPGADEHGTVLVERMTTTANGVLLVKSELTKFAGNWLKVTVTAVSADGKASAPAALYLRLAAVEPARFTSHESGDTLDLADSLIVSWTTDAGHEWFHVTTSLLAGEPGEDDAQADVLTDHELINARSMLLDKHNLIPGRWLKVAVQTYDERMGDADEAALYLLLTDVTAAPEAEEEPEAEPEQEEAAQEEEPTVEETPVEEPVPEATAAPVSREPLVIDGMTFYPAEKIDWFTGGIQQLLPRGAVFQVYDVETGLIWWAKRSAGGNHADIEPMTEADSEKFLVMYGEDDLENIREDNHWQRRPCLVTVEGRTFACSLYGVPHNLNGDTLPDNGMEGQVCLHFTGSLTHNGKSQTQDQYHRDAIEQAWLKAPNGYK